jgi:hypothetical protein
MLGETMRTEKYKQVQRIRRSSRSRGTRLLHRLIFCRLVSTSETIGIWSWSASTFISGSAKFESLCCGRVSGPKLSSGPAALLFALFGWAGGLLGVFIPCAGDWPVSCILRRSSSSRLAGDSRKSSERCRGTGEPRFRWQGCIAPTELERVAEPPARELGVLVADLSDGREAFDDPPDFLTTSTSLLFPLFRRPCCGTKIRYSFLLWLLDDFLIPPA